MASTGSTLDSRDAPHVCPCCRLPLVQAVDWESTGDDHWRLLLACPNCEWTGERMLTDALVERLEDELEAGTRQLIFELARMTQSNMREYAERFTTALAQGGILPEDF
jgi:hypothetical protein